MNVTEVRDSDFKNVFSGIFNFTVGILIEIFPPQTKKILELQTTSTEREAVGLGSMNAVCVWLRTIGLSDYDRRFSEEQVYGSALLDLSELNLIELGMDKLGDRITFMLQREMLN